MATVRTAASIGRSGDAPGEGNPTTNLCAPRRLRTLHDCCRASCVSRHTADRLMRRSEDDWAVPFGDEVGSLQRSRRHRSVGLTLPVLCLYNVLTWSGRTRFSI